MPDRLLGPGMGGWVLMDGLPLPGMEFFDGAGRVLSVWIGLIRVLGMGI